MKKILFFAAAAIMMVGCSKDQVLSEMPQDNAINFGMYFGRDAQSRAAIMDVNDLKDQSFGVFAYYTDDSGYKEGTSTPNFMFNQIVEWKSTAWAYSPLKYWPNEATDSLSFFAYAPHIDDSNGKIVLASGFDKTTASAPKITYTLADLHNHVDLLWATPVYNVNKQSHTDNVKFTFNHALSRIGFKAVAVIDEINGDADYSGPDDAVHNNPLDGNTTITLDSIIMIGFFPKTATLDLRNGQWSDFNDGVDSLYKWGPDEFKERNVTTTKTAVLEDDSYLTVFPCQKRIWISAVYTVKTKDDNLEGGYSVVTNRIQSDFNYIFNFQQGYAYNFVLHIGLNSVKFDVEVADWNTLSEQDIVVNVPLND